jgi:hypothetical protein
MNRRERRRGSKIKALSVDQVVAVHEAGHAVAKYVAAVDMGLSHDDCIAYIDLGHGSAELSHDKTMILTTQGTVYGPVFSAEIDVVFHREHPEIRRDRWHGEIAHDEIVRLVAMAATEGANIEKWLNCRALDAVLGPMAEAAATGKAFTDVWTSYECENDVAHLVTDCERARLDTEQQKVAVLYGAIERGRQLIYERPEIWTAINALAKELLAMGVGRMEGKRAAAIIGRLIQSTE